MRSSPTQTSQNLLEQSAIDRVRKPRGYYKLIVLDILIVVAALGFGYSYKVFLANGTVVLVGVSALLLLVFSAFGLFLTKSLKRRILVLFLETVGLLFFFFGQPIRFLSILGLVIFAFLVIGEISSRSEILNSVEIKFLKAVKPFMKKTVTALTVLVVATYLPQWSGENVFISGDMFKTVFAWASNASRNFYPEINFNSTVDEFLRNMAAYQLAGNELFKNLSPAMQQQAVQQAAAQIKQSLSSYTGLQLSGGETMNDAMYNFIVSGLKKLSASLGAWFMVAWVVIAFLFVRSLGWIFWWLAAFLAFLLYQLLLALNILSVHGEPTVHEMVEFL